VSKDKDQLTFEDITRWRDQRLKKLDKFTADLEGMPISSKEGRNSGKSPHDTLHGVFGGHSDSAMVLITTEQENPSAEGIMLTTRKTIPELETRPQNGNSDRNRHLQWMLDQPAS